jgi:MFS superfamily sulfate permease-like transporter
VYGDTEADDDDDHHKHGSTGHDVLTYSFAGSLSFVNVGQHVARLRRYLQQRPNVSTYVVSLEATHYFDVDGLLGLQEVIKEMDHAGKHSIVVTGIRSSVLELTKKSEWLATLQKNNRVFVSNEEAYDWIRSNPTTTNGLGGVVIDHSMEPVAAVLRRPVNANANGNGNGNGMYPSLENKA